MTPGPDQPRTAVAEPSEGGPGSFGQPLAPLALADGFPTGSREVWRSLVAAVLDRSGVAYAAEEPDAVLTSHTDEGLPIRALYTAADLADIAGPERVSTAMSPARAEVAASADPGWDVRQKHSGGDAAEVNRAVLADLEGGVTSIWLELGRDGLAPGQLAEVLDGVHLNLAPIALDAGPGTLEAGAAYLKLLAETGIDPAEVRGSLGSDPIGLALRTGTTPDLSGLVESLHRVSAFPALRAVTVDGTVYHDAGAGESEEIAVATSAAVAYLRAGVAAGWTVEEMLPRMEFRFAVTDDQFPSMAKLRAARRVWARVAELCGASDGRRAQRQHAVTSTAMMTRRNPWANILRATVAAFAAATAGADAITVTPFDSAIGRSDSFARRLARNTQAVLLDEVGLARVTDPGAGSWYLESLTAQIAEAAWSRFTALERGGGAGVLDAVTALLADTAMRRDDAVARRSRPITGVSAFVFLDEVAVTRPSTRPSTAPGSPAPGGLHRRRWAEPYEALRDRSDVLVTVTGHRPRVFIAVADPVRAPVLAQPAIDLFATGGLESLVGTGSAAELVAAFTAGGTEVACVSGPDADATMARALESAGAHLVQIAADTDVPALLGDVLDRIENS